MPNLFESNLAIKARRWHAKPQQNGKLAIDALDRRP